MEYVIIDGNNVLYRCIYGSFDQLNSKMQYVGGLSRFLFYLKNMYNYGNPIIVFDSGFKSERRLKLFPEYKQNRIKEELSEKDAQFIKNKEETLKQLDKLLPYLGVPVVQLHGVEADDIIYILAKNLEARMCNVIISSSDKDFFQAVSPNIYLHLHHKDNEMMTPDAFISKFGFEPKYYPLYASLKGDSSDNIDGVSKVGEKTAMSIIQSIKDPDIDSIIQYAKDGKPTVVNKNIIASKNILERNMQLMDLSKHDLDAGKIVDKVFRICESVLRDDDKAMTLLEYYEVRGVLNS
jgi:DNA polymerase-1